MKPHSFRKHPVPVYQRKTFLDFEELSQPIKLWDGWLFDGVLIHDDDGCSYSLNDIKQSWMADHLLTERVGHAQNIYNMNMELRKRVALSKPPKVCLMYEQPNGDVIEKIFNLVEEK